jgi:hypothetical protein
MQSDQINSLAEALAKAQGEMKPASKDSENPHFKNKYADLASVWDACREPLARNGLAVVQRPVRDESGMVLVTTLMHISGQWVSSEIPLPGASNQARGLQEFGSALTYARRYGLAAMVGVAPDDDDGEAAVAPTRTNKPPAERPYPRQTRPGEQKPANDPAVVALAAEFDRTLGLEHTIEGVAKVADVARHQLADKPELEHVEELIGRRCVQVFAALKSKDEIEAARAALPAVKVRGDDAKNNIRKAVADAVRRVSEPGASAA